MALQTMQHSCVTNLSEQSNEVNDLFELPEQRDPPVNFRPQMEVQAPANSLSIMTNDVCSTNKGEKSAEDTQQLLVAVETKNRRKKSWYNAFGMTYKRRSDDFHRLFPEVPAGESLIVDYSCALQKEILVHGRMYVSSVHLCFHANIMRWQAARICIRHKDIIAVTKEKTAIVIPNAIEVRLRSGDKYFFASFASRDKSYLMLFRIWQHCLLDQIMTQAEILNWVKQCYGNDLGSFSSNEDDEDDESKGRCSSKLDTDANSIEEPEALRTEQTDTHMVSKPNASKLIDTDNSEEPMESCFYRIPEESDESSPDRVLDDRLIPEEGGARYGVDLRESLLHRTYDLDLEYMFECLFSKNAFSEAYLKSRKVHVEDVTEWMPCPDSADKLTRTLTYSIRSNLKILGSSVISTVETQILHRSNNEIVVDIELNNSNIPYSDKFYVVLKYCLTTIKAGQTELRISGDIQYRSRVWQFTKSLIEKNTFQALRETFQELDERLYNESTGEANKGVQILEGPGKKSRASYNFYSNEFRGVINNSPKSIFSILLNPLILIILLAILLDGFLYWKLRNLEMHSLQMSYRRAADMSLSAASDHKWLTMLQEHQRLYDEQVKKWEAFANQTRLLLEEVNAALSKSTRILQTLNCSG